MRHSKRRLFERVLLEMNWLSFPFEMIECAFFHRAKIDSVIEGGFQESISLGENGLAELRFAFGAGWSGASVLESGEARKLLGAEDERSRSYHSWPKRTSIKTR